MIIHDPEMISAIIDYLDLPISKKADALRYDGRGKACFCYHILSPNVESVQVDLFIDVNVYRWGETTLEVFSYTRPTAYLRLTSDRFYVVYDYAWKGRLQYDNFYIASLD